MVDLNRNENLIYETNLTNVGFANLASRHEQRICVQCLILDLRTFCDSEDFLFTGTIFHYQRKLYVSFSLVDGHHF